MTKTTFKEKSLKSDLWSQKKHLTDNIRTKEDPTTLTTHPTTSHNIKLTKREDVCDCLKNSCVCTRFLVKSHVHTRMFCQKSRIHVGFWTKSMYTCSFLAKIRVYMQLFFKQLRTSSLLVSLMLGKLLGGL